VRTLPLDRELAYTPTALAAPLHLADVTMFWAAESGGVKRYLRAKHDFLQTTAHWRHTLVVPGTADDASNTVAVVPGVPVPFSAGYRAPLRCGPAERALRALSPDLIEAGDPYRLAWSALHAGARLQVPVVAFYHSDLPAFFRRLAGPAAEQAAAAYVRHLYPRFDTVFAPSRYIADKLADLGVARVELQPLGVDTRLFHPARRSLRWRAQLGLPRDARVLLYVGRYAPEKNLDVLCDAVDRLNDGTTLVTIGAGPTPPSGRHVRALPYEGDAHQLAAAMASADAFVHAGDQETFGLVALEAMASGVPWVAWANWSTTRSATLCRTVVPATLPMRCKRSRSATRWCWPTRRAATPCAMTGTRYCRNWWRAIRRWRDAGRPISPPTASCRCARACMKH
jgi:alpha-1,6-mannosyltransferase